MPNEEKDLKDGEETTDSTGQGETETDGDGQTGSEKSGEEEGKTKSSEDGQGEETITVPKSEWDKTNSDLENYRTATKNLKKRVGDDDEDEEGETKEKKDASEAGGEETGDDGGTADPMAATRKSNQNRAKKQFFEAHPELAGDSDRVAILSAWTPREGDITAEDFAESLEDARILHLHRTGKLDETMKAEAEKAKREGANQATMEAGRNAGTTNGGSSEGTEREDTLSAKGKEMAQNMGVDPKEVAKTNLEEDKTIDMTKSS